MINIVLDKFITLEMPRLLAAEYMYSAAMDDCFNDYITTSTTATQQEEIHFQAQQHLKTSAAPSNAMISCCSHPADAQEISRQQRHILHIHTISSSDEEIFNEHNSIGEGIKNMSSEDSGDFEGFDDISQNSSGLVNDISRENLNASRNYLKRHLHININDYHEDSEGVVEPGDVENDNEEINICDDRKLVCRSKEKITPKKLQTKLCESYTPNKRKKHESEANCIGKFRS